MKKIIILSVCVLIWGMTQPVMASVNLALSGTATQSSTFSYSLDLGAQLAIDGNTDGDVFNGSVTHTKYDLQAWWQVDLQGRREIEQLVLWNRTDIRSERLTNFTVSILDNRNDVVWSEVFYPVGGGTFSPSLTIDLPLGIYAQFVKIQLNGQNMLSLAEVEVWGSDLVFDTNFALSGTATQSSIFPHSWDLGAQLAIDGNTDGDVFNGSVTHTEVDVQAWWQVDLLDMKAIESIVLWNRTDIRSERLTNFTVSILDNSNAEVWSEEFYPDGSAGTFGTFSDSLIIDLEAITHGQFVKVQLHDTNILSLAEVQVWGSVPIVIPPIDPSLDHGIVATPEPGTLLLLALGLVGLVGVGRKMNK
jgi:hypothetical protein